MRDEHLENFEMLLRRAKASFESISMPNGLKEMNIVSGLVDAVMFDLARARRISRDAPDSLNNVGLDAATIDAFLQDVADHRNVAEHWQDVKDPRKPKVHLHRDGGTAVDETSLIILGPREILKGKLNIHDVYLWTVARLAELEKNPKA